MWPILLTISLIIGQSHGYVPGCHSLYGSSNETEQETGTSLEDIPLCFCDDNDDAGHNAITVTCLYGSTPQDMAEAVGNVTADNKTVHQVYLNHMEFEEEGIKANFFENIFDTSPKELTIGSCPNPLDLVVHEHAFNGMKELINLTITDCVIPVVPSAIHELKNLKRLHLSTSIEQVGPLDFAGMTNLEYLDISENYLEYVDPKAFVKMPSLETLVLGPKNDLNETIFLTINNVPSLKLLDLTTIQLSDMPLGGLNNLENLEELHMTTNNLENITQGMFEGLTNLKMLDLRVNLIEKIEPNAFADLQNLEELKLAGNFIAELKPEILNGLKNLKILDVGWCEFDELKPNTFAAVPNLEELDLRHNENLNILHPESFAGLSKLKILNLSTTDLEVWKGEYLKPLKNLKMLDLSETSIASLPDNAFEYVPQLEVLYLRETEIKSMSPSVIEKIPNLKIIDVSDNAWLCDDKLGQLAKFITKKYMNATDEKSLFYLENSIYTQCDRPYRLEGEKIMALNFDELEPYDPNTDFTTTTTTIKTTTTELDDLEETTEYQIEEEEQTKAKTGESSKLIIAIVVIVLAIMTIIILVAIVIVMRKKKRQTAQVDAEMTTKPHTMTNGDMSKNGEAHKVHEKLENDHI